MDIESKLSSLSYFGKLLALLVLAFLIYWTTLPDYVEGTDFSNTLYIADRMLVEGKASELYVEQDRSTNTCSPFDEMANKRLPHLTDHSKRVFLFAYPPILPFLTKALGYFPAQKAYVIWQICSIFALFVCAFLSAVGAGKRQNWKSYFLLSFLYAPIFQVLLEGQMDLIVSLLPLMLGYFSFSKGRPILAGLFWSILFLKPQFIIVVLIFMFSFALAGQWKPLLGFVSGSVVIVVSNVFCLGLSSTRQWWHFLNHQYILQDAVHLKSKFLMSSLPMLLIGSLPEGTKPWLEYCTYIFMAGLIFYTVLICRGIICEMKKDKTKSAPFILILSIAVLPLVSKYLLLYNLSVGAILAMVAYGAFDLRNKFGLKCLKDIFLAWAMINLYLVCSLVFTKSMPPIILISICVWFYARMLFLLKRAPGAESASLWSS